MSGEQTQGRLTAEDSRGGGQQLLCRHAHPAPAEREAMFAIYGFCRKVDDIADDMAAPPRTRGAAGRMARLDRRALSRRRCGRGRFPARGGARFDLAEEDFLAVIDGMRWMSMPISAGPICHARPYCDRVASAVGRLSVNVFGMERARA
jgi:phytoene synthase